MPPRSLILAAHGSTAAKDSNQPLFELAERIAQLDQQSKHIFQVVTPAFLLGEPEMTSVLDQLPNQAKATNGDVVIVPVMTSQGYYLKKLPGKFNENQSIKNFKVCMSSVLGVHPAIPTKISDQISRLLAQNSMAPEQTTVAIIGHGTRRNTTSGKSTYSLTEKLKSSFDGSGLSFTTGFLDQDPSAESIAAEIQTPNVLIVPFLVSRGPHTTIDVPTAFGLPSGADLEFPLVHRIEQRTFIYAPPLATYPGMDELCLELAIEALSSAQPINFSDHDEHRDSQNEIVPSHNEVAK